MMVVTMQVAGSDIGRIEITNTTGRTGDDDVNTYEWWYTVPAAAGARAVGSVVHRYGNGAALLAAAVLAEVALRMTAATTIQEAKQ